MYAGLDDAITAEAGPHLATLVANPVCLNESHAKRGCCVFLRFLRPAGRRNSLDAGAFALWACLHKGKLLPYIPASPCSVLEVCDETGLEAFEASVRSRFRLDAHPDPVFRAAMASGPRLRDAYCVPDHHEDDDAPRVRSQCGYASGVQRIHTPSSDARVAGQRRRQRDGSRGVLGARASVQRRVFGRVVCGG